MGSSAFLFPVLGATSASPHSDRSLLSRRSELISSRGALVAACENPRTAVGGVSNSTSGDRRNMGRQVTLAALLFLSASFTASAQILPHETPPAARSTEAAGLDAGSSLVDLSGLADLISQKAKEARAATLVSLESEFAGGLYLPVWTVHATGLDYELQPMDVDYLEVGAGAELREGGRGAPLLSVTVNIPAFSGWIWGRWGWAKRHVRRSKFPPVFIGPFVRIPLPGRTWVVGSEVGGLLSVRLGGGR